MYEKKLEFGGLKMQLIKAKEEHISELVRISKEAFDSDVFVGATEIGGPPEYNSFEWHIDMMKEGHLFTAVDNDKIVGGAIIFLDANNASIMYIGRIFVNPSYFKKGYGIAIMEQIENLYPNISIWELDTPVWNIRTNRFYKRIGYKEIKRDNEFVYYRKIKH